MASIQLIKSRTGVLLAGLSTMGLLLGCEQREATPDRVASQDSAPVALTTGVAKSADGVEIHYETAGRGDPVVVFVHGWSCDRGYWRDQMVHLSRSHRVVALDLGGHGESGLGRAEWTIAAFANDVRAVVEALGLRNVVLVGHSMGGPIIVEGARLMPDRVRALVPVDTFNEPDLRIPPAEREKFLGGLRQDFAATTAGWVKSEMFTRYSTPLVADRIARDMAAGPSKVGVSAMESLLDYQSGPGLASVTVPIRLINADHWPTNLAAARRHRPELELAVLPRTGHFLMLEAPEEFNRVLLQAVNELGATADSASAPGSRSDSSP